MKCKNVTADILHYTATDILTDIMRIFRNRFLILPYANEF